MKVFRHHCAEMNNFITTDTGDTFNDTCHQGPVPERDSGVVCKRICILYILSLSPKRIV